MQEAKEWMERAEKDLEDAEFNLRGRRFEVSAFLSHQAAEKALKALFIRRFRRLWRIHDLKQLAERVGAPSSVLELCDRLNPHYIGTRYPVKVSYDRKMAGEALSDARKVVEWAKRRMGK